MITSLIAAWIKKQKFVEKINEIDKYLININTLCEEIEVQFLLLERDRIPYDKFKEQYIPRITQYVSSPSSRARSSVPPHPSVSSSGCGAITRWRFTNNLLFSTQHMTEYLEDEPLLRRSPDLFLL